MFIPNYIKTRSTLPRVQNFVWKLYRTYFSMHPLYSFAMLTDRVGVDDYVTTQVT